MRDTTSDSSSALVTTFLAPIMERLEQNPRYRLARRLYTRNEEYVPPLLFLGGVGWDATTLRRIDALVDNLILGVYLLLLGGFIVLTALQRSEQPLPRALQQLSTWSVGGIQFLAGGLFSAYVIYFTQSASLGTASLFLLVLVAVLVANEFIWDRTVHLYGLLGVYTLAVLCYFTFVLPILWGRMGADIFALGVALSAGLVGGLVALLIRKHIIIERSAIQGAGGIVAGVLAVVSLFYALHWIPPVPLAMRHGGIYRSVDVEENAYALTYDAEPAYAFWEDPDMETVPYAEGDTVYCFAAIFAPTELRTDVYHRWAFYDERKGEWVTTDRIGYDVLGGRANGYRGYTFKRNVHPGDWRVTIETDAGRVIGKIRFEVVPDAHPEQRTVQTRRYSIG